MEKIASTLKEQWTELKAGNPHLRIRNAAEMLKVSEAELLATQCGETVTRLQPSFTAILGEIESLGYVMALSRNNDVVHERKGVYLNPELNNPHVGLFVGADIDLRIFWGPWGSAFAVTETMGEKPRYSLQFFAKDGEAIHKIYLTEKSNVEAYHALVAKYKSEDQSTVQEVSAVGHRPEVARPDSEIDVENFRKEWIELKDTHDFYGMVKKYGLTRTQALRLAPEGGYAVKVNTSSMRDIVTRCSEQDIEVMVFVGNKGIIQIHTGPVKKLLDREGWFNVLDPEFNMHARESAIAEAWVVRKPTVDGMVTALECYDKEGTQIVQFFGKRKPGIPELESWRKAIAETEQACANV